MPTVKPTLKPKKRQLGRFKDKQFREGERECYRTIYYPNAVADFPGFVIPP